MVWIAVQQGDNWSSNYTVNQAFLGSLCSALAQLNQVRDVFVGCRESSTEIYNYRFLVS
jgi:hypothetical protein